MRRFGRCLALLVAFGVAGVPAAAQHSRPAAAAGSRAERRVAAPLLVPAETPRYGTEDYRITIVGATEFVSWQSDTMTSIDPATLSRYCWGWCYDYGVHYYATLDLPAGAIIDYIGVNTATTADAVMGFSFFFRDHLGGIANLASVSFPAHGFQTDMIGPLNVLIPGNHDRAFILDVEQAPSDDLQYLGYVEVWWRLVVSDPPAAPTFGDVPTSHPFYQFIEALAASGISGGCGSGNYCPDAPLTRGQMAVFLAKALGLHWPN
jgi:hypothetical protein